MIIFYICEKIDLFCEKIECICEKIGFTKNLNFDSVQSIYALKK